jgi:DNA polymerase III subunit beta
MMALSAPAKALIAAIAVTAPAAIAIKKPTDRKPPPDIPVRIVAEGGTVMFIVTNQRGGVTINAGTAAKITAAGEMSISATRLNALLAAFTPNTPIEIAADDAGIRINSASSTYYLPALPDPPAAFAIDRETGRIELSKAAFLKLLEVLPAANTESSRRYLNGAFLHNIGDRLNSVSTDGVQLLRVGIVAGHFGDDDRRLIVPTPAGAMLVRLLRQVKVESVTLRRSRSMFSVTAPGFFELTTSLIDGTYPKYERVIPVAGDNSVTCQRAELLAALTRLEAVTIGDLVRLSWGEGGAGLLVSLPRQPRGGVDTLAAQTTGHASMVFSLPKLAELVDTFDDDAIQLGIADRALLLRQGNKSGVLTSRNWHETEAAA